MAVNLTEEEELAWRQADFLLYFGKVLAQEEYLAAVMEAEKYPLPIYNALVDRAQKDLDYAMKEPEKTYDQIVSSIKRWASARREAGRP